MANRYKDRVKKSSGELGRGHAYNIQTDPALKSVMYEAW